MAIAIRIACAVCLALAGVGLAQDNPIVLETSIYIVTPNGELVPATSATPGQVVEYQIVARNSGPTTLPAGRTQINGPVLSGFSYVPGSALRSADLLLEFSEDGGTFTEEEPPRPTLLRWTALETIEPDEAVMLWYRVIVDPRGLGAGHSSDEVMGFRLVSYEGRWEHGMLYVVGEVMNVGTEPRGVQLHAIARDASGRLVDSATFWPASTANIRPGASFGIRFPLTSVASAVRVELQIVDTTVW